MFTEVWWDPWQSTSRQCSCNTSHFISWQSLHFCLSVLLFFYAQTYVIYMLSVLTRWIIYVFFQFNTVSTWYAGVRWPEASSQYSTGDMCDDCPVLLPFYEGSFLHVLLNKLSRMLHQVINWCYWTVAIFLSNWHQHSFYRVNKFLLNCLF